MNEKNLGTFAREFRGMLEDQGVHALEGRFDWAQRNGLAHAYITHRWTALLLFLNHLSRPDYLISSYIRW